VSLKNISRVDSKDTHGWFLRLYREGQTYSKFFSDSRYGSQEKALEAAQEYKAEYEKKYQVSTTRAYRQKPQRNNKTGVLGVSETYMRSRTGKITPCFTVSWRPKPNVSKTKKFSIATHGRQAAFEMAVAFRKKVEAEMLEMQAEP
jgi:hypothetical protein